jgi:hypothetical protein
MVSGIFHKGSGIGNQLHRYVMARVLALDKGTDFGMIFPENWKGKDFMNLDMGVPVKGLIHTFDEKKEINEFGIDVRDYDWNGINHIKDFTLIDGEFQGEKYYEHHLDKIREWLKVEPLEMEDDLCVIGFRGGEYVGVKDLFLPQSYWDEAMRWMREINPNMKFEVHTDDPETAQKFFPKKIIASGAGFNWRSVRYAKYLIISNSSLYILPALLGDAEKIIAPAYWAGHNKGYWQLKQNYYKEFSYL